MGRDVYTSLSEHISKLAVGPPHNDYLVQILRESLSEGEAKLLSNLPTQVAPFEPITAEQLEVLVDSSTLKIEETLNRLAERGLLFKGRNKNGEFGYALHQFGFGMPQAIFWPNEIYLCAAHGRPVHSSLEFGGTTKAFGGTSTKVFRWIPINRELGANKQAILPYARIDEVIAKTTLIAQVNCNCRVMSRLKGRPPCKYPLDVCMKYDDLAEYVIHVGIGRKLSQDEAMAINRKAEEARCVHFADNVVEGEIKHACNCCPCCCWARAIINAAECHGTF